MIASVLLVVDTYDEWCVLAVLIGQFVLTQRFKIEVLAELLLHSWRYVQCLHIIYLIGRVKHRWHIVAIPLLCDADRYPDVAWHLRIDFELKEEEAIVHNSFDFVRMHISLEFYRLQVLRRVLLLLYLFLSLSGVKLVIDVLPILAIDPIVFFLTAWLLKIGAS